MTATVVDNSQMVSDVDTNMMGIRSRPLYELLKRVVEGGDYFALSESDPGKMLGEIIERITVNIPEDAFSLAEPTSQVERSKQRLVEVGQHLTRTFQSKGTYPFTIVRICELCYDPLKYFRVYELEKFVNAIASCCFVETSWKLFEDCTGQRASRNHSSLINGDSHQEDVSLSKISWINKDTEKELAPFIKEIEGVMSVNFGFDDDDDDDDENMGVDLDKFKGSNEGADGDFIIQEYYEDDPEAKDDSDDDDDDDYVEDAQSDGEDEEQDGVDSEDEDTGDSDSSGKAQRKRKPMELDDFDYVEKSARRSKLTTPKKIRPKSRTGLIESPECSGLSDDQDTPSSSQEEERPEGESQSSGAERDVSFLASPGSSNSNRKLEEGKIRGVTHAGYERDLGSPLSNRTR